MVGLQAGEQDYGEVTLRAAFELASTVPETTDASAAALMMHLIAGGFDMPDEVRPLAGSDAAPLLCVMLCCGEGRRQGHCSPTRQCDGG